MYVINETISEYFRGFLISERNNTQKYGQPDKEEARLDTWPKNCVKQNRDKRRALFLTAQPWIRWEASDSKSDQ